MKIPEYIINIVEKECEDLKHGKVSLGLVFRGSHLHYEIEKKFTFLPANIPPDNIKEIVLNNN